MPSGKNVPAITLSFSRQNLDIAELLTKKKLDKSFNQNNYVCNAIRFYEKNKDKINNLDQSIIEKIVDKKLETLKKDLINNGFTATKEKKLDDSALEDNLSDINIEDD